MASNNVQWKGTDICMDLYCACGEQSHADGFTFGFVQCPHCERVYQLVHNVPMTEAAPGTYVNPLRATKFPT
jgi:hypothetical protein